MRRFQAFANATVFGFLAVLFLPAGVLSKPFLILLAVSTMFVVSGVFVRAAIGRLLLVGTWLATIVLIAPHLPAGLVDGGIIGAPMLAYLFAGLLGAIFLPARDWSVWATDLPSPGAINAKLAAPARCTARGIAFRPPAER